MPVQPEWTSDRKKSLRPGQPLGPRLKGMKPSVSALSPLHLSGRNSCASSPKYSRLRWLAHDENTTRWPFWTSTLDSASGPPPFDKVVSLLAVRALNGTGGYTLMAAACVSVTSQEQSSAIGRDRTIHTLVQNVAKICHASKHVVCRRLVPSNGNDAVTKLAQHSLVFGKEEEGRGQEAGH